MMVERLQVQRLTFAQRLQERELLWQSLSVEPGKLKSPVWHKKILAGRLAKIEAGKAEFLTVTQLKKRLAKRTI